MKRGIIVIVVLVTALSVALYWRLRQQHLDAERASGGSATVEGTELDVVSRLPARVKRIAVREGQRVKAGQVLVELDCAEPQALLAQAQAAVSGAEVALEAAKSSVALSDQGVRTASSQALMARASAAAAKAQRLAMEAQHGAAERATERVEQVHMVGAVSDQKLDQSKAQLEGLDQQLRALDAQLSAARARTSAARSATEAARIKKSLAAVQIRATAEKVNAAKAARDRARVAVGECTLAAPRGGYVLSRNFEPGEVVLPGSRILTLVDIDTVEATFYLPNAELSAAQPDVAIEARADTYPGKVFAGRVAWVGAEAEFTPRNVQTRQDRDRLVYAVRVQVPNVDGLLRPGMPVEITIPGTERRAP